MKETQTVTGVGGRNKKVDRLQRQGWELVSTSSGPLGVIYFTLQRDLTQRLPSRPTEWWRRNKGCRHNPVMGP